MMNLHNVMKEIPLTEIGQIQIGHAQDLPAATGCTVILCPQGAAAGVDVRGGGPASRETQLLNPVAAAEKIHAVLLSGGSAFGLDAAGGVMQYLEERNIGFETGAAKVPLVCASCIYDLIIGASDIRPDKAMGYQACVDAQTNTKTDGCIGVGTGATVGKFLGPASMMKSGLGSFAVQIGDLKIGAIVAVNALGDVFDSRTGLQLAGPVCTTHTTANMANPACADAVQEHHPAYADTSPRNQPAYADTSQENRSAYTDITQGNRSAYTDITQKKRPIMLCTEELICRQYSGLHNLFTGNTTIGAVITNGKFTKTEMNKIAAMAQNGLARSINPVHTTADGDSVYALSVGDVTADLNVTGTLAAQVMSSAIERAIYTASSLCGVPSYSTLLEKKQNTSN